MTTKVRRILGLDVGDARVGVAISDPLGISAQALETIEQSEYSIDRIREICEENDVVEIVVGMPLMMDGTTGEQAEKTSKYVKKLEKVLKNIDIHLIDERLSTAQAERVISGSKLKNKAKSRALDRVSAAILLDTYLNSKLVPH